jgi:hypothetical protein
VDFLRGSVVRSDPLEVGTVVEVGDQDVVEAVEGLARELLCAAIEGKAASESGRARPRVGALAHVPVARSGALDVDPIGEAASFDEQPHDSLGRRRAADVAGADEADAHGGFHRRLSIATGSMASAGSKWNTRE